MKVLPAASVVLAAVVGGLLFVPVFGVLALALPIGVTAVALVAVDAFAGRRVALVPWRPLLLAVTGLLAVAETTLWSTTTFGLPTGSTLSALWAGATDSWQLALQSTWPARPVPDLLLFVPLLVVLAAVTGLELLHRSAKPLLALAPSFALVVLSQFYSALTGWTAAAAALAYAVVAGSLLAVTRADRATLSGRLPSTTAPVALAVGCAVALGALLPSPATMYSLKENRSAPIVPVTVASPLDEIASRLGRPDAPVFQVRGDAGVDRWPVVVLDQFDGVNWTAGQKYRRLGTELRPGPAVTVGVQQRTARIEPVNVGGPWLPSQTWPAAVSGAEPLVEEQQGSLLQQGSSVPGGYTLSWWEPRIGQESLLGAAIDPYAPGGLNGVGTVPAGISELAEQAVRGMRPSLQSALLLEQFFRDNYQVATGQNLPTGHSWPQLADFLQRSKRGTSEQFAAAYVALARIRGIPARLAVGYRANQARDYTVRNGDVYAWPEVAVEGVGWVQLDPSQARAAQGNAAGSGLAAAAAQAREQLPAPQDLRDPAVAPPRSPQASGDSDGPWPWAWLLGTPLALIVLLLLGIPVAKAVRAWRRKRRAGNGKVIGAWEEARDRLRAHGLPVSAGMTVRDLKTAAAGISEDERTLDGLRRLGVTVDLALWSGAADGEHSGSQAWAAVRDVRRGLARRGWRARLRAVFEPRTLLPPRG